VATLKAQANAVVARVLPIIESIQDAEHHGRAGAVATTNGSRWHDLACEPGAEHPESDRGAHHDHVHR
jgi:hypothetical protein